jgi:hypothetical protein
VITSKIEQRLEADPPDFLHVAHPGYADDDGHEDDRSDQHADDLDEGIAEWLHLDGEAGRNQTKQDAQGDGNQHLDVHVFVKRLARAHH